VPVRLVVTGGKVVHEAAVRPSSAVTRATGTLPLPARLPKRYALKTRQLATEDGQFRPGMVLVDNGTIAGVGQQLTVGADVPTYDVGAAVVTPGLVAGLSPLGFAGAIDDPAEADAGQVRAADVYDPQHRSVRRLLAGGFTSTLVSPGSVNVVAGGVSGVRLGAAESLPGDNGVKFVLAASARAGGRPSADPLDELPIGGGRRAMGRGPDRYPGSLAGQVELIERVLSDKAPATELYVPNAIREEIQRERRRQMAAVLDRKQVAFFEAHTRAEIDAALRLITRFQLRGVLVGPEDIRPFLDDFKRLGVGIVARPARAEDYDRPAQELADAATAGIPVAFGSGTARQLRLTAALVVNAGMPREAAWRGLTTAAAQMAGLPETAGRLTVGGPADLVVWDGSPLDLCSRSLCVVVDGKATRGDAEADSVSNASQRRSAPAASPRRR
jgi:imidazolonepropionase-like amidohydrolase